MSTNAKIPVCPPLDSTLLLPEVLAFHERHNADLPIYAFKKDGMDDLTEISYSQFAKACRRVPHALNVNFDGLNKPVVALIARTDTLIYHTVVMGLMNAGIIPFPISPRNTPAAIINLLQKTACHHIITTRATLSEVMDNVASEFKKAQPEALFSIIEAPVLGQLYPELSTITNGHVPEHGTQYPTKEFKPSRNDVAMYLHSSGSTGLPKHIPKTFHDILDFVRFAPYTVYGGRSTRVRMAGMQLPPFHAMGVAIQLLLPLYVGVIVSFFPPTMETPHSTALFPDPDNILEHTEKTRCTGMIGIPAFIQIWAHDERSVKILSRLEFLAFGGGALGTQVGQHLVEAGVTLRTVYGGTEFGVAAGSSIREEDKGDWDYMEIDNGCNPRMVPHADGTYELQVISGGKYQPSVLNLPDVDGYTTSDLFKRHPTKDYLWKIIGRIDDVIIHSSGEKTVPAPMENIIRSSPYIHGAVMFGQGHDQPGVLIEPNPSYDIDVQDIEQVAQFRNLIWPIVEDANKVAPAFSKVFKELILITDRRKPMIHTVKGTASTKASLKLYAQEIEELYKTVESTESTESIEAPQAWDIKSITQWLLDQVGDLCPGRTISTSENLFEQGLDSLSATILRRRITGALQSIKTDAGAAALQLITQNTVYQYPTVDALSQYLVEALHDPRSAGTSKSQVEIIEEMVRKYSFDSSVSAEGKAQNSDDGTIVALVTGSTGYLGSQVLHGLLLDSRVSKVYTLNRPSKGTTSAERHLLRFRDKGLDETLLGSTKVTHLESDSSEKRLGLPESLYRELSDSVNVIIHVAWRLDFNLSLASFESNLRGTYNLIELGRSGAHAADTKFIFTSSVGTAQSWDPSSGPFPEELLLDAQPAVGSGYGESKYVAERILATSGLRSTSLRIGQITGADANGAWAVTDWVPILVKSSIAMNALPSTSGNISWLPMRAVSNCILDLVSYDNRYPQALNIVHPHCTTWNSVMAFIQETLRKERNVSLPLVPFQEWFAILEKQSESSDADVAKIPAVKLYDFYKQMSEGELAKPSYTSQSFGTSEFATTKMEGISPQLAALPQLAEEDASKWITYWISVGLFD